MSRSVDPVPVPSPALAIKASLAASGLLRHHRDDTADDQGVNWSMAQAVHQGDRLLRTARSMLVAHAQVHGDHCSLWAVDGPEVVAVACEGDATTGEGAAHCFGQGQRLAVGLEAARLLQRSTQGEYGPGHQGLDVSAWTAMFRIALETGATVSGSAHRHLVASVVPWSPCALMLVTLEAMPRLLAMAENAPRPGHELRHSALAMGLAWSMEAVVY